MVSELDRTRILQTSSGTFATSRNDQPVSNGLEGMYRVFEIAPRPSSFDWMEHERSCPSLTSGEPHK
jgi:hypothetical protein